LNNVSIAWNHTLRLNLIHGFSVSVSIHNPRWSLLKSPKKQLPLISISLLTSSWLAIFVMACSPPSQHHLLWLRLPPLCKWLVWAHLARIMLTRSHRWLLPRELRQHVITVESLEARKAGTERRSWHAIPNLIQSLIDMGQKRHKLEISCAVYAGSKSVYIWIITQGKTFHNLPGLQIEWFTSVKPFTTYGN